MQEPDSRESLNVSLRSMNGHLRLYSALEEQPSELSGA